MIERRHRFHGLGSLRFVYSRGKMVRGPAMALKYNLNERRQTYRCSVVVSKKVSKSAVTRNRIRRRIYEIVRSQEDRITKPYDLVITVYHEQVATMPSAELTKTIYNLLTQASVVL